MRNISTIIPVYNLAYFIERTIKSISRETIPIEAIYVDDGSFDDSGEILDLNASRNEDMIVIHKYNEGVTTARLVGIQIAQGYNIGFCDGDDEIEPEMYERLLNNMKQYNAQISYCGHQVHCLDGSVQYFYNTGRLAEQDRSEGLKALLEGSIEPGLCNKLYNKTLLHSLFHSGKMDSSIKINEDLLMNYYLFRLADKLVYEDYCLYHYVKREGSASTARHNVRAYTDPIKVKQIIMQDSKDTPEEQLSKKTYVSFCVHAYESLFSYAEYKELSREIRQEIIKNKKNISSLSIKQRIAATLIIYFPFANKIVNFIYH